MSNIGLVAFVLIVGLSIASSSTVRSKRQVLQNTQAKCTTPDGDQGVCKDLSLCRPYINLLRGDPKNQTIIRKIRLSNFICNQPTPIVCCPIETYSLPKPEDGCGLSVRVRSIGDKIVGGQPARRGQYPWMALLYYTTLGDLPTPDCGGSLITNRHILTAAHCIIQTLSFARLGEYDTDIDDGNHQDIPIERGVRHPDFKRVDGHSDVGVLYLQQHVEYTDDIRPICLPFYNDEVRHRDYTGFHPFIAGWGYTENGGNRSNILMEVQIEIQENNVCDTLYGAEGRKVSNRQFNNAIMCAGYLSGGRGDCNGDSGGPLMIPIRGSSKRMAFHQFGIVSYGVDCARQGIPGVFASVQWFVDWITEKISEPV